MIEITSEFLQRFWQFVDRSGNCWQWIGGVKQRDRPYGKLVFKGKRYSASRVAFYIGNGIDPADAEVCHSCDNPRCVNPAHLFLGSHQRNMEDCISKGRFRLPPCAKAFISPDVASALYDEIKSGRLSISTAAEKFGVNLHTVKYLVRKIRTDRGESFRLNQAGLLSDSRKEEIVASAKQFSQSHAARVFGISRDLVWKLVHPEVKR